MREYVGQFIKADRGNVAGILYFYSESLVWKPRAYRYNAMSFDIPYRDIKNYEVMESKKKHVTIDTESETYAIDIYHIDLFMMNLDMALRDVRNASGKKEAPALPSSSARMEGEDDLSALARLAALHDSGALTDEEFTAMKAKIISGK